MPVSLSNSLIHTLRSAPLSPQKNDTHNKHKNRHNHTHPPSNIIQPNITQHLRFLLHPLVSNRQTSAVTSERRDTSNLYLSILSETQQRRSFCTPPIHPPIPLLSIPFRKTNNRIKSTRRHTCNLLFIHSYPKRSVANRLLIHFT
jgi:hypothetical protein